MAIKISKDDVTLFLKKLSGFIVNDEITETIEEFADQHGIDLTIPEDDEIVEEDDSAAYNEDDEVEELILGNGRYRDTSELGWEEDEDY